VRFALLSGCRGSAALVVRRRSYFVGFSTHSHVKKYLSTVIVGCLCICGGFALCYLREDHGARIPDGVRACFERSFPKCTINYVTTPQIHIRNASEDKFLMIYRISFRNLEGIPMSIGIFPAGKGTFEADEGAY
jgi:hypothetical protein